MENAFVQITSAVVAAAVHWDRVRMEQHVTIAVAPNTIVNARVVGMDRIARLTLTNAKHHQPFAVMAFVLINRARSNVTVNPVIPVHCAISMWTSV